MKWAKTCCSGSEGERPSTAHTRTAKSSPPDKLASWLLGPTLCYPSAVPGHYPAGAEALPGSPPTTRSSCEMPKPRCDCPIMPAQPLVPVGKKSCAHWVSLCLLAGLHRSAISLTFLVRFFELGLRFCSVFVQCLTPGQSVFGSRAPEPTSKWFSGEA